MIQRSRNTRPGPKSLSGSQLLRKLFREELKKHRKQFHGVFLDIFSGEGSIAKYLRAAGYPVISIDICDDPRFDVLDSVVASVIFGWVCSGCVLGIWLATPCTTWSRARHGPLYSAWGPLRDNNHIYGFPRLSVGDRSKVVIGNKTMQFSARLIRLCLHAKVVCFLENPCSSMMWVAPPIQRISQHAVSRRFVCDFVSMVLGGASELAFNLGSLKILVTSPVIATVVMVFVRDLISITSFSKAKTLWVTNFGLT